MDHGTAWGHRRSAEVQREQAGSDSGGMARGVGGPEKLGAARPRGVDISGTRERRELIVAKRFSVGNRVLISPDFFWAKGATGTISEPPPEVTFVSGPWDQGLTRTEHSALGEATVYWVWFDEPQRDADGDGPYRGGSIHENALTL